ncbi:U3 small nucleolar ribonucleoprotein [Ordospora colligata]|uniref:U3 small nucleolar ribonucleoprotein n=1 Tax=Ordospora colligata OC4 TaxID=1354746 RepID=A0A0B2UMS8_9MICR|nr:U3 small nucleolar ribonucleoprotein [Ordospora colligata OC4]KHN70367.1 U3 small nucleolar ribonucleoprotein [Ordospora colligata OC4]TBU17117.1 U3 small nucleolar ribonucleoprotein [Ordospora colligata]TBU17367.1 U3 small nucleolar ribonucleoprotein [Ordospora colligata]TBU19547.1 U3 small nucleolar ribonucleoprotein [Ordospora colligata]
MNSERIEEIEKFLVKDKEWKHMGEVDKSKRPKDSLLAQKEIDFRQGPPLVPFSSKQNDEIERVTLKRIREGTFDNYEYKTKHVVEVVDAVDDVNEVECEETKDIISLYNEIEGDLMNMVDFGNNGFVPDAEVRSVRIEEAGINKKKQNTKCLDKIKNVTVIKK